jgi:hypothetical protein
VELVVDKVALGQVFSDTSVSPANYHSANCSRITIIIWGWYCRPIVAAAPNGFISPPNNNNSIQLIY